MNHRRFLRMLLAEEGIKLEPYQDHKQIWTIGVGRTSILGQPVTPDTPKITEALAMEWLAADAMEAITDAERAIPIFHRIRGQHGGDVRREVLAGMAFQMGYGGLMGFKQMRKALLRGYSRGSWRPNYKRTVAEMADSKWLRVDTPPRAKRMIYAFEHDRFELEY